MLTLKKETFTTEKDLEYFNNIKLGTLIGDIKDLKDWTMEFYNRYYDQDSKAVDEYIFTIEKDGYAGNMTIKNLSVSEIHATPAFSL